MDSSMPAGSTFFRRYSTRRTASSPMRASRCSSVSAGPGVSAAARTATRRGRPGNNGHASRAAGEAAMFGRATRARGEDRAAEGDGEHHRSGVRVRERACARACGNGRVEDAHFSGIQKKPQHLFF